MGRDRRAAPGKGVRQVSEVSEVSARAPTVVVTRRTLNRAAGGLVVGTAGGALFLACGQGAGQPPAGPAGRSAGPVSIDVLTRAGVTNPTGHSQLYAAITPAQVHARDGDHRHPGGRRAQRDREAAGAGLRRDAPGRVLVRRRRGRLGGPGSGRRRASSSPWTSWPSRDARFDARPYFKALLDTFSVGGQALRAAHSMATTAPTSSTPTQPDPRRRGDHARGRQLVGGRPGRRGAEGGAQGEDVWGYCPATDISEAGVFCVRQFGGELLDEAGKRCLLDTPEARAGLEWVANTQAKFQVIDDLYRSGRPAGPVRGRASWASASHPGGGGGVQEAGPGAGQVRAGGGHDAPGARAGAGAPRPPGPGWASPGHRTTRAPPGSGSSSSPARRRGRRVSPAGPGAPAGARTSGTTPACWPSTPSTPPSSRPTRRARGRCACRPTAGARS